MCIQLQLQDEGTQHVIRYSVDYHPYGAARKLNQSAPFPVEHVLFGLEAL